MRASGIRASGIRASGMRASGMRASQPTDAGASRDNASNGAGNGAGAAPRPLALEENEGRRGSALLGNHGHYGHYGNGGFARSGGSSHTSSARSGSNTSSSELQLVPAGQPMYRAASHRASGQAMSEDI